MATAPATKITTEQIIAKSPAHDLLQDIFADLHPALTDEKRDIASIFTAQSAKDFLAQLMNFEQLLSPEDSYETTVKKVQEKIDSAESVRDELLAQVFDQVRPMELSYRQIQMFFENTKVNDGK